MIGWLIRRALGFGSNSSLGIEVALLIFNILNPFYFFIPKPFLTNGKERDGV